MLQAVVWGSHGVLWAEDDVSADVPDSDAEAEKRFRRPLAQALRSASAVTLGERGAATPEDTPSAPDDKNDAGSRPQPPDSVRRGLRPLQPPYGILLVAGDHTHQPGYAEALAADKRCRLVGMADEARISPRRRQLNQSLADRLKIPVLPDLSAALRRDDVQIVSICAEPMRRGRIIAEAARAGKHLYLDKPLAGSLSDADLVRRAVDESPVVAHMWSMVRMPHLQAARVALSSPALGKVRALHFDACFAKGHSGAADLKQRRRETSAPDEYELPESKRELTNVGVYPLVSLFWLTGQTIRRVFASTGNYFFREHQQNGMEDFGQMLVELEDGTIATISAGRTGWQSHPGGGLNRVCISGSAGSMAFDGSRPRVEVWSDTACWSPPERDPDDPMAMWAGPKAEQFRARPKQEWITGMDTTPAADAAYFVDCVEQGRDSDVPVILAARATEVLLGAYRSAAGGKVVALPLPR
jgi:predicted dehydrogenase